MAETSQLQSDGETVGNEFPGNTTFAVLNPQQVFADQSSPDIVRPSGVIPRQHSRMYQNRLHEDKRRESEGGDDSTDANLGDDPEVQGRRIPRSGRPKGAKRRRRKRSNIPETLEPEPFTPYVSQDNSDEDSNIFINTGDTSSDVRTSSVTLDSGGMSHPPVRSTDEKYPERKTKSKKGPLTSTPKSSPLSPHKSPFENKPIKPSREDEVETPHTPRRPTKRELRTKLSKQPMHLWEHNRRQAIDGVKRRNRITTSESPATESSEVFSSDGDSFSNLTGKERDNHKKKKHSTKEHVNNDTSTELGNTPKKYKHTYKNDDYAHNKVREREDEGASIVDINETDDNKVEKIRKKGERYSERKTPVGTADRWKRGSFSAMVDHSKVKCFNKCFSFHVLNFC